MLLIVSLSRLDIDWKNEKLMRMNKVSNKKKSTDKSFLKLWRVLIIAISCISAAIYFGVSTFDL